MRLPGKTNASGGTGPSPWPQGLLRLHPQETAIHAHAGLLSERPTNNFPIFGVAGGIAQRSPRTPDNRGTAALCPSHPSRNPESYLSLAPKDRRTLTAVAVADRIGYT